MERDRRRIRQHSAGNLYISNTNFGTGVTPSPVTFNVTSSGTLSTNGGLFIGLNGGAITFNVNGSVSAGSIAAADSFVVANNNSPIYSIINVSGSCRQVCRPPLTPTWPASPTSISISLSIAAQRCRSVLIFSRPLTVIW